MTRHGKSYAEQGRSLPTVQKMPAGAAAWLKGQDLGVGQDRLTEPYRRSAWVRAAIKLISGPISAVELEFFRPSGVEGRSGRVIRSRRDAGEPLNLPVMMQWLRSPMNGFGFADLVDATVGWRKLAGEAFWLLPDSALLPYPEQHGFQIVLARPDRMRHVVQDGKLEGWEFTDASGKRWPVLPEQVIHSKIWNPYDPWRGLGDYEAAQIAADGDYLAGKFARNVAANNGDTGPYIVAKAGIPSGDQREQILADLRAKRYAQARGEFRPVFLTGDISVEDPQIRSVDESYTSARVENRHEIAVAFGIPPSLFDVKAAYSIGSASDYFQLMFNTCQPEGRKICGMVEAVAKRMTAQDVEACLNWDEHPVFQEIRKERLGSVDSLWSKGVPMSVIDEYLGLGLPDYEGKETGYLPFSVAPASEPARLADNPDLQEPPPQDVDGLVGDAIRELTTFKPRVSAKATSTCSCGCSLENIEVRDRDPKEVAQWKEIVSARLPIIKAFRTKFDQVLMKARRTVLAKIESKKSAGGIVTKAAAADFMFSLADFGAELTASMRATSIQAVKAAGNQVFKELAKDDPWKMPSAETLKFLSDRENKLANVPDEIFGRVKATIQEQIEKGGTMDEIAAAVKAEFNKISDARGRTIAQTETSAAYGFGRQKALEDAGIKYKRWLTSGNSNVRMAHRMMNGAVVAVDDKFMVIDPDTGASDYVMGPGDTEGAAWNVINCHCVSVASAEGPAEVEPAE